MKKKFSVEIKSPCDANVNEMTKINDGFHCGLCTKNVVDLSNKTNSEIAEFFAKSENKNNICARFKTTQLEQTFEYNTNSKNTNFKYAVAVAASVLLTSTIAAQEKQVVKTEINQPEVLPEIMGKIMIQPQPEFVKFTLEGRLLDMKTLKPLSKKKFPNITLFSSNDSLRNSAEVKTSNGSFSLPMEVNSNTKTLTFYISSGDYNYTKTIAIDLNKIANKKLTLDLVVNPEEFEKVVLMGEVILKND